MDLEVLEEVIDILGVLDRVIASATVPGREMGISDPPISWQLIPVLGNRS